MSTVSVVIPTYNSANTLRLSLESVLQQDYAAFEVWVVGDGCTDHSADIVASFDDDRAQWLNLPHNSGTPSLPRNEGIRRANGKYIAYLGHDDLWFPWHLSRLIERIESTLSDFVFSLGVLIGPAGIEHTFALPARAMDHKRAISPSNWLHRKDLIDIAGPWPSGVKMGDDRVFLERVQASAARVDFCKSVSVLRFPSTSWKMYARGSDLPQLAYAQAIRQDALELALRLMTEVGAQVAGQEVSWQYAVNLPKSMRALVEWTMDTYGRHRWPLNEFLYWLWRRRAGLEPK
jgi:glycosyltransferase involved in cell wall biosynthesis